jgi:Cu2+-exporting ATPase
LFWAFFYNVIGIPLAAGVWIPLLGWEMDPMFGAAAMSLSSFCVVSNALRLNTGSVFDPRHDRKRKAKKRTVKAACTQSTCDTPVRLVLRIEGMMCGHCEGRVRACLQAMDGVTVEEVSNLKGIAITTSSPSITEEELRKTIQKQGYALTGVEKE